MSRAYDCMLTLALPAALEEELLDYLLAHPEWTDGFSVAHEEGFGKGATLVSTMEKVRGRARRCVVTVLMERQCLDPLLQGLQREFPTPEICWWTVPLTGFGRFA
jgi:hypothetical protein